MNAATRDTSLQQRLEDWAKTFGGEQLQRAGYSSMERIGSPCANDDSYGLAGQLERIVQAMEQSGRWNEARVLRAEYFMAALPEDVRLARLKRTGLSISRTTYYTYLGAALAFVAGAMAAHGMKDREP